MIDIEDPKGPASAARVEKLHNDDAIWKGGHMQLHLEMAKEWGEVVSEMRVAAEAYQEAKKLTPPPVALWKRTLAVAGVILTLGGGLFAAGMLASEKASREELNVVREMIVRSTTRMETQIEMLGVLRPGGTP